MENIPVSLGELYDKYSILQIKSEKITDEFKLENIHKELNYLKVYINKYNLDISVINEIKEINEKLWDIEDKIRYKEHKKEFDDEFISLARNVYITNDKRSEVKNKINSILKSDIIDIKSYTNYETVKTLYSEAKKYVSSNIPLALEKYKILIDEMYNTKNYNNIYLKEYGELYEKSGLFLKAITEAYIKIIKIEPSNIIILNQIGVCYFNLSEYKLSIHYLNKVLQISEISDVYNNISRCYINVKDYYSAEKNLLKAYKIDCSDSTKNILGTIYYYFKDYEKSIKFFKEIKNKTSEYLYGLSHTYLANKNFNLGFKLYEKRLDSNATDQITNLQERVNIPKIKYWDGINKCNRLLVVYEQGIGDNIQYFRFIIELSEKFPDMIIDYFCRDTVSKLFKSYKNINIILNVDIDKYDYYVFISSMPYMLKLDKIYPNKHNYINTDNDRLMYWKNIFSENLHKKLKVGFVYNGRLTNSFIEKFIPLEEFKSLCDLDIDLICLHRKNEIQKDIDNIDFKDKIHFYDIDNDSPFYDTIHILQSIDLLITIDTSIVHLAGVLNVKTFLLLGKYSEWRWSNDDTTYWYDSVELIRMKDDNGFKNILKTVKNSINKYIF
jgi:ADP-heptose:LPS heptosyltransferase